MSRKRRKISSVDQLQYIKEHGGESPCDIKFQNTNHDRIMVIVNNKCAYPDAVETYQLIRALHRVGTLQFGITFHHEVSRYLDGVTVIEEQK